MADPSMLEWTFVSEYYVPDDIDEILADSEETITAFRTTKDLAVFTNKRLIVRDIQGEVVKTYSLPWKTVNMWSIEDIGRLNSDAVLKLWTRMGPVEINLKNTGVLDTRRGIDLIRIEYLISEYVL
ncbi:MAG: PH domain-containing protein [Eggerthellaceae bacterium]